MPRILLLFVKLLHTIVFWLLLDSTQKETSLQLDRRRFWNFYIFC